MVIHNADAGDGSQPPALVRRVLDDAGYEPRYVSTHADWEAALREQVDLVVLVGGDGTVAQAIRLLGGRQVPVALLPTGTANNLAKTMGIAGDARAEHTGPRRQRLTAQHQRHRVVGRELAGSYGMWYPMPAGADPTVDGDPILDRLLRQPSPGRRPPHWMIGCAPEAVGEARAAAAVATSLVRRRPAAGAGVLLAAPTGADP